MTIRRLPLLALCAGLFAPAVAADGAAPAENEAAWSDWQKRPPGYRKVALHWVTSAKKPETRARRLATLIEDSAAGRRIRGVEISRKPSAG